MNQLIGDFKVRLVNLNDIKPDMILARDVVTLDGHMLIPKETPVAAINPDFLRSKNIDCIFVKDFSVANIPEPKEEPLITSTPIPVTSRKDFKEFTTVYENVTGITKKYISAISNGTAVSKAELIQPVEHVISTLRRKSDIVSFIGSIKEKDSEMFSHSNNVSLLCNLFGQWLGLNEEDLNNLTTAGMLHDIGKTLLPSNMINKSSTLSMADNYEYYNHPLLGYKIVQNQDLSESIKLAVLMHHERMDGTGFPSGLKDTSISDMAKIIYICNTYENLTANRGRKFGNSPFDVLHLFETSGYAEMDPKYLLIFIRNIAFAFVGNWVQLSNNEQARVFFINHNTLSRPIVHTSSGNVIDLSTDKSITITKLL